MCACFSAPAGAAATLPGGFARVCERCVATAGPCGYTPMAEMCFQLQNITTWLDGNASYAWQRVFLLGAKDRPALTICICEYVFRLSCNRVLSGGVSWLRTVAPNIHPNVDGEVAYAAPINGLAVGYIQV